MSPETAFQSAVLARLASDPALQAQLGNPARVYDTAPGGAAFPFLTLGRSETEPNDASDTDLIDHRLTLHIWGRRDDRAKVKDAVSTVRACLHDASLSLSAPYSCPLCRVVYADVFIGPDGRTVHGVVRVRASLQTQGDLS